jgi:hypothetical protein
MVSSPTGFKGREGGGNYKAEKPLLFMVICGSKSETWAGFHF